MSTKIQVKKRQDIQNQNNIQDDIEIIELDDTSEIPEIPSARKINISTKKENIENSSSEATTPNKKRLKSNGKNDDLIKVMGKNNIEVFNTLLAIKNNNITNSNGNDKIKKGEIASFKTYNIINPVLVKKSPLIKGKNSARIGSIILNESDEDNDSEDNMEIKFSSPRKKNNSKTPEKINIIKKPKTYNNNHKTIKCELSSSEDEKENKREEGKEKILKSIIIEQKQKLKNTNNKIYPPISLSPNKNNTSYFINKKTPKKMTKNNEKKEKRSKSTKKTSLKRYALNEKINALLGRKRKSDDIDGFNSKKSKTPNKKTSREKLIENTKAITPLKSTKNNKNIIDILLSQKTENEKNDEKKMSDKNYSIPELALLNHLIDEYGFENVLDTLCKNNLDKNKQLDACLQGLIDSYNGAHGKLPYLLIKILFNYFESKDNNNNNKSSEKKNASTIKSKHVKSPLKQFRPLNENKSMFLIKGHNIGDSSVFHNDKKGKRNNNIEKGKEKNNKSIKKDTKKKPQKKNMSIGSHYNKTQDGKIYKYQVSCLDGKGNAIFKCYDDKCGGMGIYELESKKFLVTKEHNLAHSEHDYILNYDKESDKTFKDLIEMDKYNAQVFKENGERIVNIY